jgi:hypothetical protein
VYVSVVLEPTDLSQQDDPNIFRTLLLACCPPLACFTQEILKGPSLRTEMGDDGKSFIECSSNIFDKQYYLVNGMKQLPIARAN